MTAQWCCHSFTARGNQGDKNPQHPFKAETLQLTFPKKLQEDSCSNPRFQPREEYRITVSAKTHRDISFGTSITVRIMLLATLFYGLGLVATVLAAPKPISLLPDLPAFNLTSQTSISAPAATPSEDVQSELRRRKKDNEAICADKNQALTNAIAKFCQNTDMMVPSYYAEKGAHNDPEFDDNPHPWGVAIKGTCDPLHPVWVSRTHCYSHFWELCATGDKWGANQQSYGCRFFIIPKLATDHPGLDRSVD